MAELLEELEAQFIRWKTAFEEKRLKDNFGETKVMESGGGSGVQISWCLFIHNFVANYSQRM